MSTNDKRLARMMDEVERQGGAHLPGVCKLNRLRYDKHTEAFVDVDGKAFTVDFVRANDPPIFTGCGRETRFTIPYLDFAHDEAGDTTQVTACFYEDSMALWPRFAAVHEDPS